MKQKLLNKLWLRVGMIVAIMTTALSGTAWAETWTRVTSTSDLLAGGTFIIGYEATANSGVIIPMANTGSATTSAAGFMYSGSTATSGGTGTINMSTVTNTSSFEVEIGESSVVENAIYIKIGDNYLGNTNTKNNCKLFTSESKTTAFTPTIATNDVVTLKIAENTTYHTLQYNTGSPRFAVYGGGQKNVVIYKKTSGGSSLTTSDLAITNASTDLTFDLYNATAQVINYTTSSTGEITIAPTSPTTYFSYVHDATNKTITVTPLAVTSSAQTITVSQVADATYAAGEATFTVSVANSTPQYNVTYKANEGTGDDVVATYYQGADVTVAACSFTRSGYAFTKWNTQADGNGTDYSPNATISSISANIDLYAQWEVSNEVVDVIDHDFVGVSSYSDWSGKTGTSGAVYAGNSAGGDSNSGDCVQIRSNNSNSGIVTTTSGGLAKKVAVTWNSTTADTRTLNVYGKSSAYSAATDLYNDNNKGTLIGTIVKGTGNSTELTITDDYEYIGLRSASGAMYLNEIRITWEPSSSSTVATPVISGTENFLTSTKVTITCATSGATIQYSTDNGSTWVNYSDPFTLDATTTVKAKATMSGMDDSAEASMTFTKITPMTVAEARAAIDANNTVSNAYVSGVVFQVDSYNSTYHSITYWISDDGTNSNPLEVYSGKGLNGADFNRIEDIQVGDVVVVKGELKKHNEDYEFNYNNELVSITTKADPELAFATTEYTVAPGAAFTAPTLTNPHSLTVTYASSDDNLAVVDENTGEVLIGDEEGTVTITATFAGDATYRAGSASYTITITDNTKGTIDNPYTVAEVIAMNPGTTAVKTDVYVKGYIVGCYHNNNFTNDVSSYEESNLALSDSPTETSSVIPVQLTNNTTPRTEFNIVSKPYNVGVAQVVVKADVIKYFSVPGLKNTKTITKVAEYVEVTSAGYATYCTDVALDFAGTDITAYVGTIDSNKQLTFTPNNQAPANTGLLLKGTAGSTTTATVPVIASASSVNDNCLTGTTAGKNDLTANDYILNKVNDGVGFYKAGQYTALGAHKAYIPAAVGNGVKGFAIDLEDDATGISLMEDGRSQMEDGAIYNVAGQRISKMQKGINIVNGKKILK